MSNLKANGKPINEGPITVTFDINFVELAEELGVDLGRVMRKTAFDTLAAVNDISPVDTGRFRASWGIAAFDIPDDDEGEPPLDNPDRDDEGNVTNPLPVSLQQGRIGIDSGTDPFAPLWIYNNLEYAEPLENGHSDQAPDGVLNLAVAVVEAEILTAAGEIF